MIADGIVQELRESGLRITSVRKQIINVFCNSTGPISVSDILTKIKAHKTTVYRESEALLSNGYLTEVDFGDGTKRYELSTLGHHHHLVCIKCKLVTEFDLADDFTQEEQLIKSQEGFKVLKHNLEFFGLCRTCQ